MVLFVQDGWEKIITTLFSIFAFVALTKIAAIDKLITDYALVIFFVSIIGIANRKKIANKLS